MAIAAHCPCCSAPKSRSETTLRVDRVNRATSSGVCFTPNRDQVGAGNKRRSGPGADKVHRTKGTLFNRLTGAAEQRQGRGDAKRFRDLETDDQLHVGR
jgi:hypothetical protein